MFSAFKDKQSQDTAILSR